MSFSGVPSSLIEEGWHAIGPWIDDAAKRSRGKYSGDDIKEALIAGECQLWMWDTPTAFGLLVTQIVRYPKNTCCWIRMATGRNSDEWANESVKTIEAWAREQGCNAMELIARPGWKKKLDGYAETHVYLEKSL